MISGVGGVCVYLQYTKKTFIRFQILYWVGKEKNCIETEAYMGKSLPHRASHY